MAIDPKTITQVGPYAVRRFIAQGGMAWVFEVVDPKLNVSRALKMLKPEAAQGEEVRRFFGESDKLAQIDHPNLVTIFDRGQDEATGCFYYVMTYVDGPPLSKRIDEAGRLDYAQASQLFIEVLSALAELHDRGIIHRDIKPANILIGRDGRPRLSDLGIAKDASDSQLTHTGFAPGTVRYMSPEQARGKSASAVSDIYAVGLSFYNALTGNHIYDHIEDLDSNSHLDLLGYLNYLHKTKLPISFSFPAEAKIPGAIQDVVRKSVQPNEADRFTNAREMLEALRAALGRSSLNPTKDAASKAGNGPPSPIILGAIAATLLVVLVIGAFLISRTGKKQEVLNRVERLEPLRLDVNSAFQKIQEIDGLLTPETKIEIEKLLADGQRFWEFAQDPVQSGKWEAADAALATAEQSYEQACQRISGSGTASRAEAAIADLSRRKAEIDGLFTALSGAGAVDVALRAEHGRLLAHLERLSRDPSSGSCDAALLAFERIEGAELGMAMIEDFSRQLRGVGPRLVTDAKDQAQKERGRAEELSVGAQEYLDEMKAGDALLGEADSIAGEEPVRARDLYTSAGKQFASAADSVSAVEARKRTMDLEAELPAGKGAEADKTEGLIRVAAQSMIGRDWDRATRAYEEAYGLLQSRLGTERLRAVADNNRRRAEEAVARARRDRVDRMAGDAISRATEAFQSGEAAYEAAAFQEAADRFEQAFQLFREARTKAGSLAQSVRDAERKYDAMVVRVLKGADCGRLEGATARSECEVALNEGRSAKRQLAEGGGELAASEFGTATVALERVESLEAQFQNDKSQPPRLVRRFPKAEKVEVLRGSPLALEIDATDPNKGDSLSFAWVVDGKPVPGETGRKFAFTPQTDARIGVRVTDQKGLAVEADWTIALKRLPPELTVTPAGDLTIDVGESSEFSATASSADKHKVEVEYVLDGTTVGRGPKFTFAKTTSGTYKLVIVARDPTGGVVRVLRTIRVVAGKPTLVLNPAGEKLSVEEGSVLQFKAAATDPGNRPVSIEYRVNGESEGRGEFFAFQGEKVGEHRLEVIARNADGAESLLVRKVTVESKQATAQTPKKEEPSTPPPTRSELETQVLETMRAYESAIEAKDMDRLERVWLFRKPDPMFSIWSEKFRQYSKISIDISNISAASIGEEQAEVNFDQSESLDGRPAKVWRYKVKLLKRPDQWQIQSATKSLRPGA